MHAYTHKACKDEIHVSQKMKVKNPSTCDVHQNENSKAFWQISFYNKDRKTRKSKQSFKYYKKQKKISVSKK